MTGNEEMLKVKRSLTEVFRSSNHQTSPEVHCGGVESYQDMVFSTLLTILMSSVTRPNPSNPSGQRCKINALGQNIHSPCASCMRSLMQEYKVVIYQPQAKRGSMNICS